MATQEIAVTEKAGQIALPEDLQGAWGTEEVTADDVVIPKLLLMHGQSELVLDGTCNIGDIIKSTDHTKLGDRNDPVAVIPFMMYKTWVTNELVGKKYEWRGEEPLTPANSSDAWEYYMYKGAEYPIDTDDKEVRKGGVAWRRDRAYNFYALLVSELESGKTRLPIRLQFKRTSWKAGKQIASFFSECSMDKVPPAIKQWNISSEVIKGEENTYQIFTVKMGANSKVDQIHRCKDWYLEINKTDSKYVNDNTDEEAVTVETTDDSEAQY